MKTAPAVGRRRAALAPEQIALRKRYIAATLVTCIVVTMVAATIHVVELGSNRMEEMRSKASYDLKEMEGKIRAAGEDITRSQFAKKGSTAATNRYTVAEVEAMLTPEQWRELDALVIIPENEFLMGSDRERDDAYNRPQRKISVQAYMIDKYPVTNAQYARFVASGHRAPLNWKEGRIPAGTAMHPVTMVSWYDAVSYAKWAGKRLPTEAEWEKAARGTDGRRWPWGNQMDPTRLNTYYSVGSTTPVTAYPSGASPYGVFDMAGNVNQWIADDFKPYPGTHAPAEVFRAKIAQASSAADRAMKVVDLVITDKPYKVLRGGSWKGDPFSTSSYHRNFSWPYYASDFFGFRCAKDVDGASIGK